MINYYQFSDYSLIPEGINPFPIEVLTKTLIGGMEKVRVTYGLRKEAEKASNKKVTKCCRGIQLSWV
jgi:hypothetical protein